ncbi:hypothetical protein CR194_06585 [Salipaludibacillus keqinensis]|uniref:Aspartyl protease n=1 Tax=Salipaludibacillus keqinensis TaxID=2045207 RepID=A0A323TNB4_9BACI|nr:aspartyl protease family protein [Salipaludibacillus keqinensis]PYZ95177.1 hypothetical protein CR194_06585 [Salipaludibacillus keqinensis]
MKGIQCHDGKLYTEMRLKFQGKVHTTERMLIDTSSPSSIISHELAEKLGMDPQTYEKTETMDSISVGPLKVSEFPLGISSINEDGVIGVDFLMKVGAKINLDSMTISSSRT